MFSSIVKTLILLAVVPAALAADDCRTCNDCPTGYTQADITVPCPGVGGDQFSFCTTDGKLGNVDCSVPVCTGGECKSPGNGAGTNTVSVAVVGIMAAVVPALF